MSLSTLKTSLLSDLKNGRMNASILTVVVGATSLIFMKRRMSENEIVSTEGSSSSRCAHGHAHQLDEVASSNRLFVKKLRLLLPIMFPRILGPEVGYVSFLAVLLTIRTGLSSWIAEVSGQAAGQLVGKRIDKAVLSLLSFLVLSFPASFVNSALKYFTSKLSLSLRINLDNYLHDKYLNGVTFYNVCNLGENRIDDVAERITVDVDHLTDEFSHVYTSTFKPIMDIFFFTYKLGKATTWRGPAIVFSYFLLSSLIKYLLTPPLGELGARTAELEGDFRTTHERIITNSEEIAFYDGSSTEKHIVNKKLQKLEEHINFQEISRAFISVIDNIIVKYGATLAGYAALLVPIINGSSEGKNASELTSEYTRNLRFLANLADAIGSLVLVSNKIHEMKGHVHRIVDLMEHLDAANNNTVVHHTKHKFGNGIINPEKESSTNNEKRRKFLCYWKEKCDTRDKQRLLQQVQQKDELKIVNGVKIMLGNEIIFRGIDIVSPDGKLLVSNLNFTVKPNQNVMISGPNGAGKSSLFRLIGELWPPYPHKNKNNTNNSDNNGDDQSPILVKPKKSSILFIPQKPYLVLGTLRDQVIYPHSQKEMMEQGITDEDLVSLIDIVDPKGHILKTWSWDQNKDWFHAFSGGQKQRVAMARLFYHRPKYAILDECTSAISDEVEDEIYSTCKSLGITLFTVSHRKYLTKHHDFLMKIEGREGKWSWEKIDHNSNGKGSDGGLM